MYFAIDKVAGVINNSVLLRPLCVCGIILSILILSPAIVKAACTGSSPTWSSTDDYASLNSCLSSATTGDTILVSSSGSQQNWNSTLSIRKGIHLMGSGSNITKVGCGSADPLIEILPSNEALNSEVEISGFSFDSNNTCIVIALGEYNYKPTTFQTKINIHDNEFFGTTSSDSDYQYIYNYNMGGVIHRNKFTGKDQMLRSSGYGDFSIFAVVENDWGSQKALFIEDNIFNMSNLDGDYIADCQFGGTKRVWRYNTFTVTNDVSWSGFIDVHGYNNSNYTSCYGDEIYGNHGISSSNEAWAWVAARGGKNAVFYNDVTTNGDVSPGVYFSYGCPTNYIDENVVRAYFWNNSKNTTGNASDGQQQCGGECPFTCDGTSNYPEEDVQAFNFEPSYDGSSGVGCGPSLPSATGCTERTAFWVTDQSCSNASGLVGDIGNNPSRNNIQGSLYECQNETWVKIYVPYPYPHPLVTHVTIKKPSPPSELSGTINGKAIQGE